jgi:hypothetical protein
VFPSGCCGRHLCLRGERSKEHGSRASYELRVASELSGTARCDSCNARVREGSRDWLVGAAANHLITPAATCLGAEGGQAMGTGVICGS